MTFDLKTTVLASTAVVVLLNVGQLAISYNQQARAAYAPTWAVDNTSTTHAALSPVAAKAHTQALPPTAPVAAVAAPAPVADATVTAAARLSSAGLNPVFAASYVSVAAQTGTPWQILAAVHETETGQSGNTARKSYTGA